MRSVKTVMRLQTENVRHLNYGPGWQLKEVIYEDVLSEDQQRIVDMVRNLGRRLLLDVEIIDVAKENVLHRIAQKERENIRTFPTLIADNGQKFQGQMNEEKVELFLSNIANKGEKKYL